MTQNISWPIGPMTSEQWMDQFQSLNHRAPTLEEYKAASQRGHISNPQVSAAHAETPPAPQQPAAPVYSAPATSMPLLAPLPKKESNWLNRTYLWCVALAMVSILMGAWALFQERLHVHFELKSDRLSDIRDTRYSWMGLIEHTRSGVNADDVEIGIKSADASYTYHGYIILGLFILCIVFLSLSWVKRMQLLRPIATTALVMSSGFILSLCLILLRQEQRINEYEVWYNSYQKDQGDTLNSIFTNTAGTGMTVMVLVSVILLIIGLVMAGLLVAVRRTEKK